ncbi:MAG TPA: trypsin-like peptidase domain-containing protein [Candidatus Binatia bacterium]|nr:trypsin-like peptidase domain-containing protein [Candidatus Binatia bacterium]
MRLRSPWGPCLAILLSIASRVPAGEHSLTAGGAIWREPPTMEGESDLDRLNRALVRLANDVRPAILQIRVTRMEDDKSPSDAAKTQSRGSGFIIDPRGYILTAHHVIDKAKEIEVRLAHGERLMAHIIAQDTHADFAILKVAPGQPLPTLSLGDSNNNRIGDLAVVFGYPFGRESSMNLGVISRPGRSFPDSASYEFIQTDAGAYAGGSGGPLLNSKGHVIGIITMASERGNMGFAIPINVIKRLVPRLMTGERLVWGWLGVQTSELSVLQAKSLGLPAAQGVLVNAVLRGHPADRGGLLKQDVILAVNDAQVDSPRDVSRLIGGLEAGRIIRLTILRGGKTLQLSMPLGSKPESTNGRDT